MAQVEARTEGGDTAQSFQKHIEDMRSLTLCKICLKPFFEPYIISCGHTYCYGCLRSWFANTTDGKKTKSCPDCRVTVRVQPAPNYILRDLTHLFIGRAELLPEDESVQEHAQDKEDAAAQLTTDREGPGLFQGVFKQRDEYPFMRGPIHDFEDGVDRCPVCFHEIEDGVCSSCGRPVSDYESESDDSIDIAMGAPPRQAFYAVESDSDDDDDDTEGESNVSGPDEYDRHDDFLDNEDEDDMDDLSETGETDMADADLYERFRFASSGYNAAALRRDYLAGSEDDSSDDTEDHDHNDMRAIWTGRRIRAPTSPRLASEDSATNYDESEEDDENLEVNMHREIQELESDSEHPSDNIGESSSPAPVPTTNRRRPVVISDDEDDDGDVQKEHDSHSPRARSVSPASSEASEEDGTIPSQNSDLESDSDSEDSDSSEEDGQEPQEVEDTEDSDDTVLPPQSRHMRNQKLRNQRARRPHQHQSRTSSADLSTPPRRDYAYSRPDDVLAQRGSRNRAARVY